MLSPTHNLHQHHDQPQPQPPAWIPALLTTPFYTPCPAHAHLRRADLNLFDTRTSLTSCQHCAASAASAAPPCPGPPRHLHICRYMYHAVVLLAEAAHHVPVAGIQPYLNNGSRVLYLDRSTQPKSRLAPHASSCKMCARTLQHPYIYCALRCALEAAHVPLPPSRASLGASLAFAAAAAAASAAARAPAFASTSASASASASTSTSAPALALPTSPVSTPASTPHTSPLPAPLRLAAHGGRVAKPAGHHLAAPRLALASPEPRPLASPEAQPPHKPPRSRRKSIPIHSPAPGPGSFVLLRAALQPLAL